jgi:pSer/pThr/pTyr-binding forkhead associated (FHA) protein
MNVLSKRAPGPVADSRLRPASAPTFHTVLEPLSHPELGDIVIDENLFAIGRTEAAFVSYPPDIVTDLSRRHARIFSEYGAVYVADLDSKNGTTVNGISVRQKIIRLQHGDELCFGRGLSYRVHLCPGVQAAGQATKLLSLTLSPERGELGLQPIVVTQFPFLISKADAAFSRYKEAHPHQVNFLSRRHAHVFLKNGTPFVEDLGSTNGTFVAGKRLDEHAVALADGDSIGFGGHHFVYRVSLQVEASEADTTLTKFGPAAPADGGDADKTTFVGAAGSFLDIFCVEHAQPQDDEVNHEALPAAAEAAKDTAQRQARGKAAIFLSELRAALAGSERKGRSRLLWWGLPLAAAAALAGVLLYQSGAPERELADLLASGDYGRAATLANAYLERHPDNAEVRAQATEALLKANVPQWLAMLQAGQFERARAALANLKQLGARNPDLLVLVGELEWIASLEQFATGKGGLDGPIRIYADEAKIKALLERWNQDRLDHQRSLARIVTYVPEFKDPYATALSHLRKLQSDDSVYLAAIERLKTAIGTELGRDRPEALEAIVKEYGEKYPRIGGLENVRHDLRLYLEIDNQLRAASADPASLGPLIALVARARFLTPPFQAKFQTLAAGNKLPAAQLVGEFQAVSKAWRAGDTKQALARLQKMAAGPWSAVAAKESAHKTAIAEQFAALQKARGAKGYDERLLAFYGALDPEEDVHFVKAAKADIGLIKDAALKRAQDLSGRAASLWQQYRANGAIEGGQRLEEKISPKFRTQARLLADADADVQQGMRIYAQLKTDYPPQWRTVHDQIQAEAEQQRKSLLELRSVLEPGLWKAKLALLGKEAK